MRILSASAIHGGAIRCPVWNTSHTDDFIIHVRGDATLTFGPYGSAGTCIINCDSYTIDGAFQQQTAPDRIDVNFNKW